MSDVFGMALLDYLKGNYTEDIITFSSLYEEDIIPLPYLFRTHSDMPPLEQKALQLCKGSILDIGCGAGCHSLHLQQKGFDATALDSSAGAIETCCAQGIKKVIHADICNFKGQKFDTLLMLMNGIGLVGRLENFGNFFIHLKTLLKPGGQVIVDSSDIIYMFDENKDRGRWIPDSGSYYGEVEFTMQYKSHKSEPFFWLFIDYHTLQNAAITAGLQCELVSKGEHFDYLARIWIE